MRPRWLPWVLGAAALWLLVGLVVAPWLVPRLWESRNVPEKWRADRWEATAEGVRARELTEAACGPLPVEVWLDFPDDADQPVLRDGSRELGRCFWSEVAPQFARHR